MLDVIFWAAASMSSSGATGSFSAVILSRAFMSWLVNIFIFNPFLSVNMVKMGVFCLFLHKDTKKRKRECSKTSNVGIK